MKKLLISTLLWLVVVAIAAVIVLRWPVVFWLLALSVGLYLIFGRRAEIEFRVGVGTQRTERRLYAAINWQRHGMPVREPEIEGANFKDVNREEQA